MLGAPEVSCMLRPSGEPQTSNSSLPSGQQITPQELASMNIHWRMPPVNPLEYYNGHPRGK